MTHMTDTPTLYCNFCGKSQHEVRKLIAGPLVFICDECVVVCSDIIHEDVKVHGPRVAVAADLGIVEAWWLA